MATVWHLLGNRLGRAKVVRVFFLPRRGFFRFRVTVAKLVPLIFTPVTLLKNLAPHGTRKSLPFHNLLVIFLPVRGRHAQEIDAGGNVTHVHRGGRAGLG